MNKLAIFDWNGTLIDDAQANWEACNHCLAHFDKGPITFDHYRDVMDFPVLHLYTRLGVDPDAYLARFKTAGLTFLTKYKELSAGVPLRRGATELFDWLLDNGYDLMVLSNYVQAELDNQIAALHVTHYFRHICGNLAFNELEHSRTTKRERLEKVIGEHGYDTSTALIVGDSLEEPEIARHLGMTSFSVTWGCLSPARLEAGGTDHMVAELAEIMEILHNRQRKDL